MINGLIPTDIEFDRLAWTIAERGIHAIPPAVLRELGFQARSAGVQPILTEILLDGSAPPVARQRAFGRIASALAHWHHRDTPMCPDTRAA